MERKQLSLEEIHNGNFTEKQMLRENIATYKDELSRARMKMRLAIAKAKSTYEEEERYCRENINRLKGASN